MLSIKVDKSLAHPDFKQPLYSEETDIINLFFAVDFSVSRVFAWTLLSGRFQSGSSLSVAGHLEHPL